MPAIRGKIPEEIFPSFLKEELWMFQLRGFFFSFLSKLYQKITTERNQSENWNLTESLRKFVLKKWNFKHFKRRNWQENLKRRKRIFLEAKEIRKTRKLKEKNYSTDNRKNADSHSRQQRFGAIAQYFLNWSPFFTKIFYL